MKRSLLDQRLSNSPYAHRQRAHGCQAVGCSADMTKTGKLYFQRKQLCRYHMQAESVHIAGTDQLYRYCFQCGKLEHIECFDGNKRTCRVRLQKRREQPSNHKKRISSGSSGSRCKRASCAIEPCCNTPTFPAATWPGAQGWVRYGTSTQPCVASAGAWPWEIPAAAQASTAVRAGLCAPAQLWPASSSAQQQLLEVLQMLPEVASAQQAAGFKCAPQAQQSVHKIGAQQVSSFDAAEPAPFARQGAASAQGGIPLPVQPNSVSAAQAARAAPNSAAADPAPFAFKAASAQGVTAVPVPTPTQAAAEPAPFARSAAPATAPASGRNKAAAEPAALARKAVPAPALVPGFHKTATDLASLLAELIKRSQEMPRDPEDGLEHMLESELAAAALGTAIAKQAVQSPCAHSACVSERLAEALVADSCLFEDLEAVTSPCAGQHTQALEQAQMALQAQLPAQAPKQLQAGLQPGLLYSQGSFTGSSLSGVLSGHSFVCSSSDDMNPLLGSSSTAAGVRNMPVAHGAVAAPSVGYGIGCNQQQPSAAATAAAALFAPSLAGYAAPTCTAGTAGSLLAPSAFIQAMPLFGCYAQSGVQPAAPCTLRAAAATGFQDQQGDRLQAMQVQVTKLQDIVQCLKQQLGM